MTSVRCAGLFDPPPRPRVPTVGWPTQFGPDAKAIRIGAEKSGRSAGLGGTGGAPGRRSQSLDGALHFDLRGLRPGGPRDRDLQDSLVHGRPDLVGLDVGGQGD